MLIELCHALSPDVMSRQDSSDSIFFGWNLGHLEACLRSEISAIPLELITHCDSYAWNYRE